MSDYEKRPAGPVGEELYPTSGRTDESDLLPQDPYEAAFALDSAEGESDGAEAAPQQTVIRRIRRDGEASERQRSIPLPPFSTSWNRKICPQMSTVFPSFWHHHSMRKTAFI